jgi:hypothetical protein
MKESNAAKQPQIGQRKKIQGESAYRVDIYDDDSIKPYLEILNRLCKGHCMSF